MTSSSASKKPPQKRGPKKADEGFKCDYCKKVFVRENSLLNHMCVPKQRILDKDLKHVKLAFWVYDRFWKLNYSGSKARTYEHFMDSKLYLGFVRFGRYLLDINAVSPQSFVDYLLKNKVKIDDWLKPSVYEAYIRDLNTRESADAAIKRNVMLMEEWAISTGEAWTDFFRKIHPNQATLWILSGRISPWVIYATSSSQEMFNRMSDEQMTLVHNYINPDFWRHRIKYHEKDVEVIRAIFEEAGI